ncbi:MAG: hypothetical protein FWC85_02635 [Elusimicrobia bacterium]|nr:hypothetical protein [Elusimicrobiota bacterium]
MKRVLSLVLVCLFVASGASIALAARTPRGAAAAPAAPAAGSFRPFAVYIDNNSPENNFVPSGWMGDFGDIQINLASTENPRSGRTAIRINYTARMTQGAGWAGVFWQHPPNNWGDRPGGFDLRGATRLTFWARGANGGERLAEVTMGGITGEFPDSDSAGMGPIELTTEWQKFTIDLRGRDLSHIIGGFAFALSRDDNPNGATFFFDDIIFE